jgi:hypothetical protein
LSFIKKSFRKQEIISETTAAFFSFSGLSFHVVPYFTALSLSSPPETIRLKAQKLRKKVKIFNRPDIPPLSVRSNQIKDLAQPLFYSFKTFSPGILTTMVLINGRHLFSG